MASRNATQIIEKAKSALKLVNALSSLKDEQTRDECISQISSELIDVITIGARMDARTGTIDPSARKRTRKPAPAAP